MRAFKARILTDFIMLCGRGHSLCRFFARWAARRRFAPHCRGAPVRAALARALARARLGFAAPRAAAPPPGALTPRCPLPVLRGGRKRSVCLPPRRFACGAVCTVPRIFLTPIARTETVKIAPAGAFRQKQLKREIAKKKNCAFRIEFGFNNFISIFFGKIQ